MHFEGLWKNVYFGGLLKKIVFGEVYWKKNGYLGRPTEKMSIWGLLKVHFACTCHGSSQLHAKKKFSRPWKYKKTLVRALGTARRWGDRGRQCQGDRRPLPRSVGVFCVFFFANNFLCQQLFLPAFSVLPAFSLLIICQHEKKNVTRKWIYTSNSM